MTTAVAVAEERHSYLDAPYGIASWLLTKDHKRIAMLYLISITVFFAVGGLFAAGVRLEHGKGCPYCGNTGFRGRMGIFELFLVNEEIQRLIYESATAHVLRKRARELGMRTMRDDGLRKVLAGQSTIEEVISTTIGDEN